MPGLVAFGRRWSIATDDFLLVGIVDSIFFLPWFCWLAVVYADYTTAQCACEPGLFCPLLDVSLAGSCCLFLLNWLLAVSFVCVSARGTISQHKPRRHVVKLVYVKLALSLLDFAWSILGTVLLHYTFICEEFNVDFHLKVVTICQWFMTLVRIGMVWMFYDCQGGKRKPKKSKNMIQREYFASPVALGAIQKWKFRFQSTCFWCVAPSKAKKDAINILSELLAFLSYDLDLVASDLVAGLLLYRRKCLLKYKLERDALASNPAITLPDGSSTDCFPTDDMAPWMNLQLASRYFIIGMGVFGWPWMLYRNIACGLCSLWKKIVCCFPCRGQSSSVVGDNCCGCNVAGLQIYSGVPYDDIVHSSFVNRVYEIPFFVAMDPATKSVILTIRGSMSFSDALTDVAAGFAIMDDPGCPPDTLCHSGVLNAARKIKVKIEEKGILETAFLGREDYTLVVTGHSLGAAVASVLTLLLRGAYPSVRCFAFAPPPVLSKPGLLTTQDCILTVIYGNDSVPFLNYRNIQNMVMDILECLQECKLPKYKVFLGQYEIAKEKPSTSNGCGSDRNAVCPAPEVPSIPDIEKCETVGKTKSSPLNPSIHTDFFLPGKIIHIRHSKNGYRLRVSMAEDFRPLMFRSKMIMHHFPHFMEGCLRQLGEATPVRSVPC